jgi:hypothetical protein
VVAKDSHWGRLCDNLDVRIRGTFAG